jgi:hypothetical protein
LRSMIGDCAADWNAANSATTHILIPTLTS